MSFVLILEWSVNFFKEVKTGYHGLFGVRRYVAEMPNSSLKAPVACFPEVPGDRVGWTSLQSMTMQTLRKEAANQFLTTVMRRLSYPCWT